MAQLYVCFLHGQSFFTLKIHEIGLVKFYSRAYFAARKYYPEKVKTQIRNRSSVFL